MFEYACVHADFAILFSSSAGLFIHREDSFAKRGEGIKEKRKRGDSSGEGRTDLASGRLAAARYGPAAFRGDQNSN